MSKFKGQIGDTPPLSSGESTEGKAQPSLQSVKKEPTQTYMQTTRKPSLNTSKGDNSGRTTPDNSPTTEKTRQHAVIGIAALKQLENSGLIKRFKVLSKDPTTGEQILKEIRIVFDPAFWTEDLELK